jgi:hypothetical protein
VRREGNAVLEAAPGEPGRLYTSALAKS